MNLHCNLLLILAGIGWALPVAAIASDRPADFANRWVRTHRFTLMGLTQRPAAVADDRYTTVGFNTMLAWKRWEKLAMAAQRMGMGYHCHLSKGLLGGGLLVKDQQRHQYEMMTATDKAAALEASRPDPLGDDLRSRMRQLVQSYPDCEAFVVWDEPKRPSMKTAGKVVTWLKQTFPDALVYSNAYPFGAPPGKYFGANWVSSGVYAEPSIPYDYTEYLRDIVRIIGSEVLMVDIYPYRLPPEGIEAEFIHRRYFNCLADVRRVGQEMAVPYWIFVQAFGKERYTRRPSEADLRMQVFVSLAYGFTGIAYFTYDHVFDGAMLQGEDAHRSTDLYYDAIWLNREVANLGRTLRFLTSTDVRFIPGRHKGNGTSELNLAPMGTVVYEPGAGGGRIRDIGWAAKGPMHNALIGYFQDDQGADYFLLVNLYRGEGLRAADSTMTMTVTFDRSVTQLSRLSRETGAVEKLALNNGQLTLTLPGGTGDLFKIGDASFPGLDN